MATTLIAQALRNRVQSDGSAPLITYYDLATGERTELSAISFSNWVAKTANFLLYEIGLSAGDQVRLRIAETHPGHWVTLIWELAVWQAGGVVRIGSSTGGVSLAVVGPDEVSEDTDSDERVACSLHPLGLGFADRLPDGVIDYSLEVRAQPDSWSPLPIQPQDPAWAAADRTLTQADLVAVDHGDAGVRRLVHASDPWTTASEALIAPVLAGGSTVIVVGSGTPDQAREDQLERIAASERATIA